MVEHWITDPAARVRFSPKSWEFFSALFAMLCSLLRLSCRKMGAPSEMGLNSSPKWLNSAPKCFYVIINDDFLEEGGVTAD